MVTAQARVIDPTDPGNESQLGSFDYGAATTYDSNFIAAWRYATGLGVKVAVIDDGFTPAVVNNFDTTDSQSFGAAGISEPSGGFHGTTTSALIGGAGAAGSAGAGGTVNGSGMPVGLAPNATVIGEKVDFGSAPFSAFTAALTAAAPVADVINNSWGMGGYGQGGAGQPGMAAWYAAVQSAVQTGRGGLGDAVVFAGGNDRAAADDMALQPITDDPRVIAVAASQTDGTVASFSNPGAGLLVAADGVDVAVIMPNGATGAASGTSYAAPTVSSVIALMLQANPALGWRDIQEILADSAYAPKPSAAGFTTNQANDWNGGGRQFSDDLGFGVVDANVAVNLSRAWTAQAGSANLDTVTLTHAGAVTVPSNGTAVSTLTDSQAVRMQHVQATLTDTGVLAADTKLVLVSPSGTQSVLVDDAGWTAGADATGGLDLSGTAIESNAFWGEAAAGTWTLEMTDSHGGVTGTVQDWSLTLWGDATGAATGLGAPPLVFTPQYATLGAQNAGRDAIAPHGATAIDLIGLTRTTQLDLNGGAGEIDGVAVSLQPGLRDASADGSTGLTVLVAAQGGSTIQGGDGTTVIYGDGGDDSVTAGLGPTVIWSGSDSRMQFTAGSGGSSVHGGSGETDITDGAGADRLILTRGSSGGLDRISDFAAGTDTVHLIGYGADAAAAAVAAQTSDGAGGALLLLADGTRLDFAGIGHVSQSAFV